MHRLRAFRRPAPRRAPTGLFLGAIAVGTTLLLAAWPGCTVTRDNYKVLSLFFDGVPDPNSPANVVDPRTGEVKSGSVLSMHAPFMQEQCSECHTSRMRPGRADSGMCLKCHAAVPGQHERMHGPVAAGACLWCHNPHESSQLHLMRDTDRKVCAQCHTPALMDATRVPEHADASRACLECHVGHGGPEQFLLRAKAVKGAAPAPEEK